MVYLPTNDEPIHVQPPFGVAKLVHRLLYMTLLSGRYTTPHSMHHGISLIPIPPVMESVPVPSVYTVQLICCFRRCVGTARVGFLTATVVLWLIIQLDQVPC